MLGVGSKKKGKFKQKLSFLAVIWSLWKERNRRCFEGKVLNVISVLENIKFLVASRSSVHPLFIGI